MLLAEIKSVLTFAAFNPEPDDSNVSWAKRFEGHKSLLINVSRSQTSWRSINKKGRFEDGGVMEGSSPTLPRSAPMNGVRWSMAGGAPSA